MYAYFGDNKYKVYFVYLQIDLGQSFFLQKCYATMNVVFSARVMLAMIMDSGH
jgi:hypothetical protein